MERFIENFSGEEFDLLIVGGGISGAAVAYDASLRGLKVALVEKQDFGCATSSVTSKLIHGGFRYLANFELGLVRESLAERRTLEDIAPNFVYPLPGLFVAYNLKFTNNIYALAAGMTMYDLLSYDKGWTWDKSKSIPRFKLLSAQAALELEPNLKAEGLKGAGMQYDCGSLCPERLTLSFMRSAIKHGAKIANYAKVEQFLFSGGRVQGVAVKDLIRGGSVEIKAKLTINCGGPWADIVLGLLPGGNTSRKLRRSEGIHVIAPKLLNKYMIGGMGKGGSHFFVIPWRNHTLIGTTDKEYVGDPDEYKVTKAAIMELLEEVNSGFGKKPIEYSDVIHCYGGMRPLVEDQTKGSYQTSRKYEIYDNGKDGFEGLLTVEGGKYTTSRNLAESVLTTVGAKLGRELPKCETAKRRLVGCEIADIEGFVAAAQKDNPDFGANTMEWLARHYGMDYGKVLELAKQDRALAETLDADGELLAQVVYAVREEMAKTLKDVMMRRTGLGTLGNPGDAVIGKIADVVARELGWDDNRKAKEIAQVREALTLPQ